MTWLSWFSLRLSTRTCDPGPWLRNDLESSPKLQVTSQISSPKRQVSIQVLSHKIAYSSLKLELNIKWMSTIHKHEQNTKKTVPLEPHTNC